MDIRLFRLFVGFYISVRTDSIIVLMILSTTLI
jgi:hypothetical protein